MSIKDIENDLKVGKLKNIYLLYGEEVYLVKEYCNKLKSVCVDKSMEMMNFARYEGKAEIDDIISACETLPFMGEKRFVLVKDSKLFESGRKDATEALKEYIPNISESTVLCFCEEKADKRNSLYKAVAKAGVCCEMTFLKDSELVKWLNKKTKGAIGTDIAEYLVKCVGTSMEALEAESDKLINYGGKIDIETVDRLCTKSPENNVFEIVEAIGMKNPSKALEVYNSMLRLKQSPVYVLKTIARQFKIILECKYLRSKGMSSRDISTELGIRQFVADRCIRQAENFTTAQLIDATKECARCDIDFKSGKITDKIGVEVIILKYSK